MRDELFLRSNWTRFNLGEPRLIDGFYYLTVKTGETGFEAEEKLLAILESAKEVALDHLIEYFFRLAPSSAKECFLESGNVEAEDWFLEARPGSRVKVFVKINEASFKEIVSPRS